jgi:hypothetical protein
VQLADLAGAEPADRGREQRRDLGAQRRRQLRGPRQQEVAGEDGAQVAPPGVDALDVVAGGGLVEHVVVVQRPDVDQLDRDPAGDGLVADGAGRAPRRRVGRACRRREGGHQRAEPLAAGPDQM